MKTREQVERAHELTCTILKLSVSQDIDGPGLKVVACMHDVFLWCMEGNDTVDDCLLQYAQTLTEAGFVRKEDGTYERSARRPTADDIRRDF